SARLASGSARLASGSARLASGSARLASGNVRLASGNVRLASGSARLARVGQAERPSASEAAATSRKTRGKPSEAERSPARRWVSTAPT
ncbi:hypothetical protein, partial [Prauserella flavalba]|uniref:hypothetical protein n=1 Tax=Prauserella flavalba TaxID=1477506 RepID=UPI0036ED13EA